MALVRVVFHFQDNNGQVAQVRLYCPFTALAAVEGFALTAASRMQAVSSAVVSKVELIWTANLPTPAPPGPLSNVELRTVLFYRNGPDVSALTLPSATLLPVETSGPYSGIRTTRELLDVSGMLTAVQGLVAGALDPLGRPYGPVFSVGGRTKL